MMDQDLRPGERTTTIPDRTDAGVFFIGRIHTPWTERSACPRRGDSVEGPECRIDVFEPWRAGLDGIDVADCVQVLYWMHLARRDLIMQRPNSADRLIGTFALRSPVRPNPVASSVVRLVRWTAGSLIVRGLDCIDGTPLLDLKPDTCPASHGSRRADR